MWQKQCRLTLADKFFGGGAIGGVDPNQFDRSFGEEKPDIKSGYNLQQNQLENYVRTSPLLQTAQTGALDFWKQLSGLTSPLTDAYTNTVAPILASGGALTPEGERDVTQATAAGFASRGNVMGNQALGAELLNRESAQQSRFNTALGQAQGITGAVQGAQTGGLNQLLGVQNAEVGTFSQLQNPILAYLGNLFGGNQQAQVAGAQINQQAAQAGANKQMQGIDTGINAVGSIAGAAIGASDERIKTKIRDTGLKTEKGVPYKIWEYITKPGVEFLGHIAQDVEKKDPKSVVTDKLTGIKGVTWKYFPVQLTQEAA